MFIKTKERNRRLRLKLELRNQKFQACKTDWSHKYQSRKTIISNLFLTKNNNAIGAYLGSLGSNDEEVIFSNKKSNQEKVPVCKKFR